MTKVEAVKKWRDKQIEKGRCRYCKNKAVKGKTMCQYHLDYLKWTKKFKGEKK